MPNRPQWFVDVSGRMERGERDRPRVACQVSERVKDYPQYGLLIHRKPGVIHRSVGLRIAIVLCATQIWGARQGRRPGLEDPDVEKLWRWVGKMIDDSLNDGIILRQSTITKTTIRRSKRERSWRAAFRGKRRGSSAASPRSVVEIGHCHSEPSPPNRPQKVAWESRGRASKCWLSLYGVARYSESPSFVLRTEGW
jgi:hypothetical protein